jgi:hypothetical protein
MRLRKSFLGADLPAEKFLRLPIPTIRNLLIEIEFQEHLDANEQAHTTAVLAAMFYEFRRSQLSNPSSLPSRTHDDFLPYPKLKHPDTKGVLSKETRKVIEKLANQRRIPMHVFTRITRPPNPDLARKLNALPIPPRPRA